MERGILLICGFDFARLFLALVFTSVKFFAGENYRSLFVDTLTPCHQAPIALLLILAIYFPRVVMATYFLFSRKSKKVRLWYYYVRVISTGLELGVKVYMIIDVFMIIEVYIEQGPSGLPEEDYKYYWSYLFLYFAFNVLLMLMFDVYYSFVLKQYHASSKREAKKGGNPD